MKKDSTAFILDQLLGQDTPAMSKKYIENNIDSNSNMSFNNYINEFLTNHPELTVAKIVAGSGISRNYGYEIINGIKKGSRDKIIALCYSAGMSLDELNHALTFSEYNVLYPKNTRDALIIMALNFKGKGHSDYQSVIQLNNFLADNNQDPLK